MSRASFAAPAPVSHVVPFACLIGFVIFVCRVPIPGLFLDLLHVGAVVGATLGASVVRVLVRHRV